MAKETTTVIKKILPFLVRLGYSIQKNLFFKEAVKQGKKVIGFTDIEVCINNKLVFLLEAKRDTQTINDKHRKQAIDYGKARKIPFVVVTNGHTFEMWNIKTGMQFSINGDKNAFPPKKDLASILIALKTIQLTSRFI